VGCLRRKALAALSFSTCMTPPPCRAEPSPAAIARIRPNSTAENRRFPTIPADGELACRGEPA
jgi:hypothetical protein